MHQRRRRSAARLLAPMALVLSIAAVLLVVQSTTNSGNSAGDKANKTNTGQTTTQGKPTKPRHRRPSYTVKLGDTLGLIAEKTGVSVEQIQTLNPALDPQNLIVGQKIKLKQ